MSCYNFIKLTFENGLFDKWIDMCYLLTMENSNRCEMYTYQLNKYKPFSTIIIQVNKGYKVCKKNLYKQSTIQDLNESYLNVFQHARANNYNNIMILEDDFFFESIDIDIVNSIGKFINNNYYHIYNLGSLAHISIPSFDSHHRSLVLTTAHCVIYSSYYIDYYIDNYLDAMKSNPDLYWNKINIIKYKYYKPLCFQTFPTGENQNNWEIPKWFLKCAIFFIKLLKIDTMYQPGFTILNILGYIPCTLFIVITIYLIYRIY